MSEETIIPLENGIPLNDRPTLDGFGDVRVEISAILGRTHIPIEQFLKLGRGAIIELQEHKNSPIEIQVNGFPYAMGEIRVLDDKVAFSVIDLIDHSRDLE